MGGLRVLATLWLSLALLSGAPGEAWAETWAIQVVDIGPSNGSPSSLGLLNGYPVISYLGAPHSLKYAALNPQTKVFNLLRVDAGGEYTSLAVDASGIVNVGYLDAVTQQLKYWRNNAGQGLIQTIDSETGLGGMGFYNSLRLDGQGAPRVSYYYLHTPGGTISGKLKYAVLNGSSWTTEFADTIPGRGKYNSLALDASGNPLIAYHDDSNNGRDLRMARRISPGVWTTQIVDSLDDPGWFPSIAVNGSGQPRISYLTGSTSKLRYAFFDGVLWHFEDVDDAGGVTEASVTSLALDSNGNPHISYFDATASSLKYASRSSGGTWTVQTVDNLGTVGGFSSLVLDASGRPVISYFDFTTPALKIAYGDYPDQDSDGIPDVFDGCPSNPDCDGNGIVDGKEGAPKTIRLKDEPIFGCGSLSGGPPGGAPPPNDLLFLLAPAAYLLRRRSSFRRA
jgi:hypothetical protein